MQKFLKCDICLKYYQQNLIKTDLKGYNVCVKCAFPQPITTGGKDENTDMVDSPVGKNGLRKKL